MGIGLAVWRIAFPALALCHLFSRCGPSSTIQKPLRRPLPTVLAALDFWDAPTALTGSAAGSVHALMLFRLGQSLETWPDLPQLKHFLSENATAGLVQTRFACSSPQLRHLRSRASAFSDALPLPWPLLLPLPPPLPPRILWKAARSSSWDDALL